jgi:hypothetical protein
VEAFISPQLIEITKMLTIKIVRDSSDIRRVQIPTTSKKKNVGMFKALKQAVVSSFGTDRFRFSYLDDEGDRCGISSEDEMVEAVHLSQEGKKKSKVLKIWLESANHVVEAKVEANTEAAAAEEARAAHPSAAFVKDIKLEDGAVIGPDQVVTKTWAFKNDGKDAWPENCSLVFVKGKLTPVKTEVPLPVAQAGEVATIDVDLRTPSTYGHHKALFTLTGPNGIQFDNDYQAWCSLLVQPSISKTDYLAVMPYMMKDPEVFAATLEHAAKYAKCVAKQAKHAAKVVAKQAKHSEKIAARQARQAKRAEMKQTKHAANAAKKAVKIVAKQAKQAAKTLKKAAKKAVRQEAKQIKAVFVEDVTIPDGSKVMAGSVVQKTWRLKNVGTVSWPEGTEIICVRGDATMTADAVAFSSKPVTCAPGDSVDVSVELNVGAKLGRSKTVFRLKIPSGRLLGVKLWLDVMVEPQTVVAPTKVDKPNVDMPKVVVQKQPVVVEMKQVKKPVEVQKPAARPSSRFVKDVTLDDGTMVAPDQVVTKSWAFKNDGKLVWPANCKLCFVDGRLTPTKTTVPIPAAKVGETVTVSVDLRTPSGYGSHKAVFQLKGPDGHKFDNDYQAWCWLKVKPSVSPASEPASEPENEPLVPMKIPAEVEVEPAEPAEQEQKLSDAEEAAIALLTEMGFNDKRMLVSLLEAAGGNVKTVLGWLMAQPRAN